MARLNKRNRQKQRELAKNIASLQVTETHFHQGPIPDPEQLKRYDDLMPGLADRIVRMAETEASHRRDLERQLFTAQVEDVQSNRRIEMGGQKAALIIACLAIIGGSVTVSLNHPVSGTALGGIPLVAIVGVFINGRRGQSEKRKEKPPEPSGDKKPAPALPKQS